MELVKPEENRPLKRPRCKSMILIFREIGWEYVTWIYLAQDRDQWKAPVNMVMDVQVPQKAQNLLTSWVTISFSRRPQLYGVSSFVS